MKLNYGIIRLIILKIMIDHFCYTHDGVLNNGISSREK